MIALSKCLAAIAASIVLTAASVAQEKKIQRSDLPPSVEKTVAAQSAGATIHGFSEEKENGQTYYEVAMTLDGQGKDVLIDASGAVVEIEQQVALDSLPVAVQRSLKRKAGKGNLLKVEAITKHGRLVAYEAKVQVKGKKSEIQVSPDGRALDHEE